MNFAKEFKAFATKGSMVDLAVGVIIGGAFGKVITSLVNDILMPPIGLLLGEVNFGDLFLNLNPHHHLPNGDAIRSLAQAKSAGVPVVAYGQFINNLVDFLIVAACVFGFVKLVGFLRTRLHLEMPKEQPTKEQELLAEIRDALAVKPITRTPAIIPAETAHQRPPHPATSSL